MGCDGINLFQKHRAWQALPINIYHRNLDEMLAFCDPPCFHDSRHGLKVNMRQWAMGMALNGVLHGIIPLGKGCV
jgi:hypothetical protein